MKFDVATKPTISAAVHTDDIQKSGVKKDQKFLKVSSAKSEVKKNHKFFNVSIVKSDGKKSQKHQKLFKGIQLKYSLAPQSTRNQKFQNYSTTSTAKNFNNFSENTENDTGLQFVSTDKQNDSNKVVKFDVSREPTTSNAAHIDVPQKSGVKEDQKFQIIPAGNTLVTKNKKFQNVPMVKSVVKKAKKNLKVSTTKSQVEKNKILKKPFIGYRGVKIGWSVVPQALKHQKPVRKYISAQKRKAETLTEEQLERKKCKIL